MARRGQTGRFCGRSRSASVKTEAKPFCETDETQAKPAPPKCHISAEAPECAEGRRSRPGDPPRFRGEDHDDQDCRSIARRLCCRRRCTGRSAYSDAGQDLGARRGHRRRLLHGGGGGVSGRRHARGGRERHADAFRRHPVSGPEKPSGSATRWPPTPIIKPTSETRGRPGKVGIVVTGVTIANGEPITANAIDFYKPIAINPAASGRLQRWPRQEAYPL